jgi:hypothetical protein
MVQGNAITLRILGFQLLGILADLKVRKRKEIGMINITIIELAKNVKVVEKNSDLLIIKLYETRGGLTTAWNLRARLHHPCQHKNSPSN